MARHSLTAIIPTLRRMATIEPAKKAFPGSASVQDLAIEHMKEALRILEALARSDADLRAKLGRVLPWEESR